MPKTPQVKPDWETGIYIGNGVVVSESDKDTAYKNWLADCDKQISAKIGVGHLDLPDVFFRDYFDDGMTPAEAIDTAYTDHWYGEIPDELWNA
tara:strand:+ start:15398 stop:15676 length:279 start_codon:yes stop_codon:yes gene_type:complete